MTQRHREKSAVKKKMVLIDLLDAGLPQTFNLFKKKCNYLWSIIKQSTVTQGMPVITKGFCDDHTPYSRWCMQDALKFKNAIEETSWRLLLWRNFTIWWSVTAQN